MMETLEIKSLSGETFECLLFSPAEKQGPALIFVHDVIGLDDETLKLCEAMAEKGYIVYCPYLFWRTQKKEAEKKLSPEEAIQLYKNFDVEAGVRDLFSVLAHARQNSNCTGKFGVMGIGTGGNLTYLMASRSDVDCVVSYSAHGIESYLDEIHDIRMPFLVHMGTQDPHLSDLIQRKIKRVFSRNEKVQLQCYENANHNFARPSTGSFNPTAAEAANSLTEEFLKYWLLV